MVRLISAVSVFAVSLLSAAVAQAASHANVSRLPYPPFTTVKWASPKLGSSSGSNWDSGGAVFKENMGATDQCAVFVFPGLGGDDPTLVAVQRSTGMVATSLLLSQSTSSDVPVSAFQWTNSDKTKAMVAVVGTVSVNSYWMDPASTTCAFALETAWSNVTAPTTPNSNAAWNWDGVVSVAETDGRLLSGNRPGYFAVYRLNLASGATTLLWASSVMLGGSKSLVGGNSLTSTSLLLTYREGAKHHYGVFTIPSVSATPNLASTAISFHEIEQLPGTLGAPQLVTYNGKQTALYVSSGTGFAGYEIYTGATTPMFAKNFSDGEVALALETSLGADASGNQGSLKRFLLLVKDTLQWGSPCAVVDYDAMNLDSHTTSWVYNETQGRIGCRGIALSTQLAGSQSLRTWFVTDDALNVYRYNGGAGDWAYRTASQYTEQATAPSFVPQAVLVPGGSAAPDQVLYLLARSYLVNTSTLSTNLWGLGAFNGSYLSTTSIGGSSASVDQADFSFSLMSSLYWPLPPLVVGTNTGLNSMQPYVYQPNPFRTQVTSPGVQETVEHAIFTMGASVDLGTKALVSGINYFQLPESDLERSVIFLGLEDGIVQRWSGIEAGSSPNLDWTVDISASLGLGESISSTSFSYYKQEYLVVYGRKVAVRLNMTDGSGPVVLTLPTVLNQCSLTSFSSAVTSNEDGDAAEGVLYFKAGSECVVSYNVTSMTTLNASPKPEGTNTICQWLLGDGYLYYSDFRGNVYSQPLNDFGNTTAQKQVSTNADGSSTRSVCTKISFSEATGQLAAQNSNRKISLWNEGLASGQWTSNKWTSSYTAPVIFFNNVYSVADNGTVTRFALGGGNLTQSLDGELQIDLPVALTQSSSSAWGALSPQPVVTPWGLLIVTTTKGIAAIRLWNSEARAPESNVSDMIAWSMTHDDSGNELNSCGSGTNTYRLGLLYVSCSTATYLIDVVAGTIVSQLPLGVASYTIPTSDSLVEQSTTPNVVLFQPRGNSASVNWLFANNAPYTAFTLPVGPYGGASYPGRNIYLGPFPKGKGTLIWLLGFFFLFLAVAFTVYIVCYLTKGGKQPARPESSYSKI